MAQTTDGIGQGNWEIEVSTDGSTWNSIAGEAVSITPSGEEQIAGHTNTADGSAPIVTHTNKTTPVELEISIVYTKTSDEAFDRVRDRWEGSDKTIYVRWAPEGGIDSVVGNDLFILADDADNAFAAPILNCLPPTMDSTSGDPAMASFTVRAPKVFRSATSTS